MHSDARGAACRWGASALVPFVPSLSSLQQNCKKTYLRGHARRLPPRLSPAAVGACDDLLGLWWLCWRRARWLFKEGSSIGGCFVPIPCVRALHSHYACTGLYVLTVRQRARPLQRPLFTAHNLTVQTVQLLRSASGSMEGGHHAGAIGACC